MVGLHGTMGRTLTLSNYHEPACFGCSPMGPSSSQISVSCAPSHLGMTASFLPGTKPEALVKFQRALYSAHSVRINEIKATMLVCWMTLAACGGIHLMVGPTFEFQERPGDRS